MSTGVVTPLQISPDTRQQIESTPRGCVAMLSYMKQLHVQVQRCHMPMSDQMLDGQEHLRHPQ
jgi:hypothetical protein